LFVVNNTCEVLREGGARFCGVGRQAGGWVLVAVRGQREPAAAEEVLEDNLPWDEVVVSGAHISSSCWFLHGLLLVMHMVAVLEGETGTAVQALGGWVGVGCRLKRPGLEVQPYELVSREVGGDIM
jgi:hypothetical protein